VHTGSPEKGKPSGKWVWVPAGGATVLKLVVDNRANDGSGDKTTPDAVQAQDPGTVPEPGNESGPEKPPEGDAT
jgi:hypothetical protein